MIIIGEKINGSIPAVAKAIADTEWSCIALLCDDKDIPGPVERRIHAFEQIMEKAEQYGIEPFRLYVDPMAVTLSTNGNALTMFAECCQRIREQVPEIHITSAVSNISFGLPVRKSINQAFVTLAMKMGLDSAIVDPTNRDMLGIIYATDALLEKDEYCLEYISAYREGRIGPSVNPSNFVLNGQYSLD